MQGFARLEAMRPEGGAAKWSVPDLLQTGVSRRVHLQNLPPVGTSTPPQSHAPCGAESLSTMSKFSETLRLIDECIVDSLDDMLPVPAEGKFFAELITRGEVVSDSGVIIPKEDRDPEDYDVRPMRARVLGPLGPASPGHSWSIQPGYEVIVPYHAGTRFTWLNQKGIEESLWIVSEQEVLAIFKPRVA